jgi:hypothetical protein
MTTTMITTTEALGRLHVAEAFVGHIAGGSTEEANSAVAEALAALIATVATSRPEVIGKLDRAWQFFSDFEPAAGHVLSEIMGS